MGTVVPMTSTTTAEAIRRELERQQVSGRELARRLAVAPMYISRRLSGETELKVSDVTSIAEALGVPVTDLIEPVAS